MLNMAGVYPIAMTTKGTPRLVSPRSDKLVSDIIIASDSTKLTKRRTELSLDPDGVEALKKAIEIKGEIVLTLSKAAEVLGLSDLYASEPKKSYLLATSLSKRTGLRVGARDNGTKLLFRARED